MPAPYPQEFREGAVALVRGGRSIPEVARELSVSPQSLRNWTKRDQLDRRERDDGLTSSEREELRRLRRENVRIKQEKEIVQLAISDAHPGLKAALAKVIGAPWQRCTVHFLRDLRGHARRDQHDA